MPKLITMIKDKLQSMQNIWILSESIIMAAAIEEIPLTERQAMKLAMHVYADINGGRI